MTVHQERKLLPWSADQLYSLVADVARYPEFLPWCSAARIRKREGDVFWADLVIGFHFIRECYTSMVTLVPNSEIRAAYTSGPFSKMQNRWRFVPQENGGCLVDFHIEFEFRSRLLQRTIGILYYEAVRRLVTSFELRARELYGPGVRNQGRPR